MAKIFSLLLCLSMMVGGGCSQPPPPPYVPTATVLDTMYRHVVWTRGWDKKPYMEVWTKGVYIVNPGFHGEISQVRFYLGNRWETFEYHPGTYGYDSLINLPAPGYNGPDRLIYEQTGEIVDYDAGHIQN